VGKLFLLMWKKSKRVLFQCSSRQSGVGNGPRLRVCVDKKEKRHMSWVKALLVPTWIPHVNKIDKAPVQVGLGGRQSNNSISALGLVEFVGQVS
jgi:hypothetical protein